MKRSSCSLFLVTAVTLALILAGCAPHAPKSYPPTHPATQRPYTVNGKTYYPITSARGYWERGRASWYGRQFHGRKTANGEVFDMYAMTAAHKTLPMNTMLLVRNLDNGRQTVVRVNDRGPFIRGRIVDLSYKAAGELDMVRSGIATIEIIALGEAPGPVPAGGGRPSRLVHQDFNRGDYFVQVGSYLNQGSAERIARRLMDKGADVVIQPYITSGYTYYRVQVYAGKVLQTAQSFERQLLRDGFPGAFLFSR
ncbi:MAG TPA: septal ring lytic transglycosylase RlpA family protein [Desulfobacteraceae bacterium]|nr:septal ring lytic transglycosylase RlpA family protein [Desulfobacteraceae bacterium]